MSSPSAASTRTTPEGEVRGALGKRPSASSRLFLPLIAVCTAVTAANIYLAAPLLPLIAHDFGSTPSAVAWLASVAQFGYAAGLLFFAPLGDSVNRRRLVAVL
ncbi:MFS transporter, partial [Streptomyces sp. E2N166]|uniref:MFS transporter n=1 Tax=Streptomyces sp. E2N166 TaxID=1851909 RepID=UPI0012925879